MLEQVKLRLKEIAYPLRTVSADDNTDDLQPLKEAFKGVRIVGLGESTHGTRDFFQLKHRLLRFLVEEMGFRAFVIESGLEQVRNVDDYVIEGKGDKYRALSTQSYWTWDTAEVIDMIDWMRDHNLTCRRGQECHFYGMDMKPIYTACDKLISYLKPVAGDEFKKLEKILLDARATWWMMDESVANTRYVLGWLLYNERPLIDKTCVQEYTLAVENARFVCQFMDCSKGEDDRAKAGGRDYYMANNVEYVLNSLPPDSKIVIWAHNAHIVVNEEWQSMGWHLRQRYGSQYCPCCLCFGTGGYQSCYFPVDYEHKSYSFDGPGELRGFYLEKPLEGSWEDELNGVFAKDCYLDLKHDVRNDEILSDWGSEKRRLLLMGAGADTFPEGDEEKIKFWTPMFSEERRIAQDFDVLFFLKMVMRARPNSRGIR